jgi:hypothetical protein
MAVVPDDFGVNELAGPRRMELATVWRNSQQSRVGMVKKGAEVLPLGTPLTFNAADQIWYEWAAGDSLDSFVYYGDITLSEEGEVGAPLPLGFGVEVRALLVPEGSTSDDLAQAAVVLNVLARGSQVVRGVPETTVEGGTSIQDLEDLIAAQQKEIDDLTARVEALEKKA